MSSTYKDPLALLGKPPSHLRPAMCSSRSSVSFRSMPACVQAGIASVEADYSAAIAALPNDAARTQGIQVGQASAAAIVALRAGDGSDAPMQDFNYPQGTDPGEFRFPPGVNFTFGTRWGNVTPFVLNHASQFRPGPPYKISSKKYAADFNEVKTFGGNGVTTPSARTPEQTQIALFWLESSPLAWNRMARSVSASRGLDLWENARLFGLLNLAMADGYIGNTDTKVRYNFWRPVTAVHLADTDGNPDTVGDPTWTPLEPNYPNPDYDSGHSLEGGAAAQVLREFFGTDNISFQSLQPDAAGRAEVHGSIARIPLVHELLSGRGGECIFADSRWPSLPRRPLKRALNTVKRSAIVRSICFCDRCVDVEGRPRRSVGEARPLSRLSGFETLLHSLN